MNRTTSTRICLVAVLAATMIAGMLAAGMPAAAAAEDPFKVLILGDSYSAGNGAGDYYGPGDCYRSHSTWGELVGDEIAAELGTDVEVTNRACSGGVAQDITHRRKMETKRFTRGATFTASSQAAADDLAKDRCHQFESDSADHADEYWQGRGDCLGDSDTYALVCERFMRAQKSSVNTGYDLVVMTLGGNDVDFSTIGTRCLAEVIWTSRWDRNKGKCDKALNAASDKAADGTLRSALDEAVTAVDGRLNPPSRTEKGQVLLLSYPYLIGNHDYEFDGLLVGSRLKRLSDKGDSIQRDVMGSVNTTVTVSGCPKQSAVFADGTKAEFSGHEPEAAFGLDGDENWWLWEVTLPVIDGTRPSAESLHPKPEGHEAESRAAFDQLTRTGALPGTCAGGSMFVLNRADNGFEGENLEAILDGLGDVVDRDSSLPAIGLDQYNSVWVVMAYEGMTQSEISTLAAYVAGGGNLYLTGERPCCEALNDSVQQLVNLVVRNGGIGVGDLGDIDGPFTVNPSAAGSIAINPQVLTNFYPDAPGGMAGLGGVTGRNVFVSNGSIPVAGVWDESDMVSGQGRMVVLMDIDWLGNDSRTQWAVNVREFLSR